MVEGDELPRGGGGGPGMPPEICRNEYICTELQSGAF